jgi:Ca-activated chloride channel family protein
MTFADPGYLLGLALLPIVGASYALAQRARRRYAVRFTNLDLLENVVTGNPQWRRFLPPLFFLLALAALVLAIARPQVYDHKPREQATVILATDRSGSMQATDVRPNRLEAAKAAAKRFVDDLPSKFRLGVVAFNNVPQLLVPPTSDRALVNATLDGLQPKGGTAIGSAIDASVSAIRASLKQQAKAQAKIPGTRQTRPPAVVVLLSDGKSTAGSDPLKAAQAAKEAHIPVNTVALGTQDATVTVTDAFGNSRSVSVPPDPQTLARVAQLTGGKTFNPTDEGKLGNVYKTLGSSIGFVKVKRDITPAFAGGALGLMLLGGLFSLLWFGRLP